MMPDKEEQDRLDRRAIKVVNELHKHLAKLDVESAMTLLSLIHARCMGHALAVQHYLGGQKAAMKYQLELAPIIRIATTNYLSGLRKCDCAFCRQTRQALKEKADLPAPSLDDLIDEARRKSGGWDVN